MSFIADIHIHSRFSMATSRQLTPEQLEYWARLKGINVVGTGDCVHPGWSAELMEKLEPNENGLFTLKKEFRIPESYTLEARGRGGLVYFMLTGEISSIYKRDEKTRKVHNIIVLPGFDALLKIQADLDSRGNIRSDGRPILGMDSRDILAITLESADESFLIPAHIWTPWFSVLGSKSGFDSIDECYGDLSSHIFAVETGLSSDPPMNRRCSFLDRYRLTSSSDAHSPEKLGREASLFLGQLSYSGIYDSLKNDRNYGGTLEYYPEEGKYHLDGHRNCGVRLTPAETRRVQGICPVCGKGLTLGVQYRVEELADRDYKAVPVTHPHTYLTRLEDMLTEIRGVKSSSSKQVQLEYMRLVTGLGSEFDILLNKEIHEIREFAGETLAEAVSRLRQGKVFLDPGYDGEFGRVRLFDSGETDTGPGRRLFTSPAEPLAERPPLTDHKAGVEKKLSPSGPRIAGVREPMPALPPDFYREAEALQMEAVTSENSLTMVSAGPGSGKTRVLVEKIAWIIKERGADPETVTALTFSNRAAEEIRARTEAGAEGAGIKVYTFHTFGLTIINSRLRETGRSKDFFILQKDEMASLYKKVTGKQIRPAVLNRIFDYKEGIISLSEMSPESQKEMDHYGKFLLSINAFDLPDLVFLPLQMMMNDPSLLNEVRAGADWLLIDEVQDMNLTQQRLASLIASGENVKTFLIGDPDQSIYGFRGAVDAFGLFRKEFPGSREIRLTKSFRCPEPVLRLAGEALGIDRGVQGPLSEKKVKGLEAPTAASEAEWIASKIEAMLGGLRSFSIYSRVSEGDMNDGQLSPSDIAVLCRASVLFEAIEKAFNNHAIPYRVVDNTPMLQREPFRSAVSEMREAFYLIKNISSPEGTSPLSMKILSSESVASIFRTLLMDRGVDTGTIAILESVTHRFGTDYPAFFRFAASSLCSDDHRPRDRSVSLMTIHGAKGLEFPVVFIPGCEEGIIPFTIFGRERISPDEERRLLYVAVTRSMGSLWLTSALKRSVKGKTLQQEPGHLIKRFPGIEMETMKPMSKKRDQGQLLLFD